MENDGTTNITQLKQQRRHNVQEQLSLKKDSILKGARYWRKLGLPLPIRQMLSEKGIDVEQAIVLQYEQDYPGLSTDWGLILSNEGHFYEFDVDLNPQRNQLVELYSFTSVSYKFEVSDNKKGIGKTYGFLAMEVLKELNNK